MGVHGLWELLAPVGRRVSVETLAGRKLPIDASIWMIQFVKAMRDERGEMVRNAHLLDFFRRICKLLFLRTKPSLSSTGAARERPGKDPQTAEKLLLYHAIGYTMETKLAIKSEKNQHKAGDHSFEQHSSGGCFEMGAGFCIDEAQPELEKDQISLCQNSDPSLEEDLSKDYLNMGGGFCLDEDGTKEDPDICSNLAVEADLDIGSAQLISSPTGAVDVDEFPGDDHSGLVISLPDSTRIDDSGTAPVNSLRAMPDLRRKRRKS